MYQIMILEAFLHNSYENTKLGDQSASKVPILGKITIPKSNLRNLEETLPNPAL